MARILTGAKILRGDENWKYGKGSLTEPALLPDGVGYTDGVELTALRADGDVIYTREFSGTLSSPVSAPDGTLYVHDRAHLHAVAPDGETRWTRPLSSGVDLAAGDQGQVYAVDDRGRLRGISSEGHQLFSKGLNWFWQKGSYVEPRVGPEGKVLAADRDRRVRAFSSDGQELWSYKLTTGLAHGPVWGPDGSAALTTMENEVVRLDPKGRETQRIQLENEPTCDPLFDDRGNLTVGDYFGGLWRIPEEGDKAFRIGSLRESPNDLAWGPDGNLLVTTRWGSVHSLGDPSWSQELGGIGGTTAASPDGIVYVNVHKAGLNAIRSHRDPEAARAEEKRKARETFQDGLKTSEQLGIHEQGGYLLVGGIRVQRKQG